MFPAIELGQFPLSAQVGQWGSHTITKGTVPVQTGTIDVNNVTTNMATITAVNLNNAILLWGGEKSASATNNGSQGAMKITLTNATTVTATRVTSEAVAQTVRFYVLELVPGVIKSIQRFPSVSGNAGTQAITDVNPSKAWVMWLGQTTTDATAIDLQNNTLIRLDRTNATTITIVTQSGGAAQTVSFDVVELF